MILILNNDTNIIITDLYFLDKKYFADNIKSMTCNGDSELDESIIDEYQSIILYDEINQEYIIFKECSLFYIDAKKIVFSFKHEHYDNDISYIRKLKLKKILLY